MAPSGYSGFMPSSAIPPPEMYESKEFRDNKFAGAAELVEKTRKNISLTNNDYKVPDRRGISAFFEKQNYPAKPCSNITTSRAAYKVKNTNQSGQRFVPDWFLQTQQCQDTKIHGKPVQSSYQMDLDVKPNDRPYLYKNGMATTSLDLCAGSVRSTHHIPGYTGFIPNNLNTLSGKFCDGQEPRLKPSTLRLSYHHNLPNYTGFIPTEACNDKGPRLSGANPKTTSGAHGEILL